MTHDEMIALIEAHRDGKTIQTRYQPGPWYDIDFTPIWNFYNNEFRIKPEPLTLDECWKQAVLMETDDGMLKEFLKLAKENGHV